MAKQKEVVKKEEITPAKLPATVAASPLSMLAQAGASAELMERIGEVSENLESVNDFRLPRMKMGSDGVVVREGDAPILEIEFIILSTKAVKQYYNKPYNKKELTPPTCYSLNGKIPEADGEEIQHATCKGCPQNEFGTNTMGEGKACRDLKPIYVLMSEDAIIPRQLTISPTSLKAANGYLMDLTERGVAYWKVVTKITFYRKDEDDKYVVAKFSMVRKITDETKSNDITALRKYWLPVMNNQNVDGDEATQSSASHSVPVDTKGEF